jgi:putative oxidoreductase
MKSIGNIASGIRPSQIGSAVLALLLGIAGAVKLGNPGDFETALLGFALLPEALIPWFARFVPILEVTTSAMLMAWAIKEPKGGNPAALLSLILSLAFTAALGSAILRGLNIDCGCFGSLQAGSSTPQSALWRAMAMAALSALIWVRYLRTGAPNTLCGVSSKFFRP